MSIVTYVAVAALMLSFVLLFLVFFLRSRMLQILKILKNQGKHIQQLENDLIRLKGNQMATPVESFIEPAQFDDEPSQAAEISDSNLTKNVPSVKKYDDFVNEFNILIRKSGVEAIDARDGFINKFNVIGISCVNASIRMQKPQIPPQFEEISPVPSGEYWAYEFDLDSFVVVPNIKSYTERYHSARALGQVFKSKFISGNSYKLVGVKIPAFFSRNGKLWILQSTGELELSLISTE